MTRSSARPIVSTERRPRIRLGYLDFSSLLKFSLLGAVILLDGCSKSGPPYNVRDALNSFKVESGFHVEKFVSEPDIASPVAMDIDENGSVYVVEDRGYPLSVDNPLGRVKMLEDTNGDGIPDRVTIFADKL